MENIAVSVVCLTYNHEKYIEQTIQSIVSQKTVFCFELIIHDDKSTDGTADIIRKYAELYPEKVIPICEVENQYSIGVDVMFERTMPYVRGKYIAFCEGDDFWTDQEKLQIQYDIMERHSQVDMCACTASEVYGEQEKLIQLIRPREEDGILTAEEVILGGGRFIATVTLFCRSNIMRDKMNFEKILYFDYVHQIKGALRGGIYYIDRNMATYRNGVTGSWTTRVERNSEQRRNHIVSEIEMLECLDKDTDGRYHETICTRIRGYKPFFEQLMDQKDIVIERIKGVKGSIYLWGMGMRGDAFMEFCHVNSISLIGVCDIKDEHIGECNVFGYQMVLCSDVVNNAAVIVASNTAIKKYLEKISFHGEIVDLQEYLVLS